MVMVTVALMVTMVTMVVMVIDNDNGDGDDGDDDRFNGEFKWRIRETKVGTLVRKVTGDAGGTKKARESRGEGAAGVGHSPKPLRQDGACRVGGGGRRPEPARGEREGGEAGRAQVPQACGLWGAPGIVFWGREVLSCSNELPRTRRVGS